MPVMTLNALDRDVETAAPPSAQREGPARQQADSAPPSAAMLRKGPARKTSRRLIRKKPKSRSAARISVVAA